ncbi:uncharacterized protein [Haliotis asinina]|uniref:uncharacterized protein n=1 Tax=Haliotis asinina TaxID=109174 RepID=UPI003531940A
MEHQVFRKLGSLSLYDCASECLTSSVCLSFGFEHNTLACFLYSNTSDYVSISPKSGFDFSDIQCWPKALSGPCFVMSCPVTTRCQVDRHGRAICVPDFRGCGHPPDVAGASITYDGHYQGAMARYTCKEDYTFCHQRNISVCHASGQWKTVADICGKFRWRNPKVNQTYDLPCGPQSNFSVFLLATPTTPQRCSVYLRTDKDTPFLLDFRFNFEFAINKTVINSKFLNRWGTEVLSPLPLTIGKESGIQISLSNGEYQAVVDDVFKVELLERQSGVQPRRLSLEGNFFVRLMEIKV